MIIAYFLYRLLANHIYAEKIYIQKQLFAMLYNQLYNNTPWIRVNNEMLDGTVIHRLFITLN